MWLLAVDSSSKDASVALLRDDRLVALVAPRSDEQHSVALFRHMQAALREAGIELKDLDAYAVASGPGAFTGLRIGLALVKALVEMHAPAGGTGERAGSRLRQRKRPGLPDSGRQRLPRAGVCRRL